MIKSSKSWKLVSQGSNPLLRCLTFLAVMNLVLTNQYCLVDKCKVCPNEEVYICRECESGYYLRSFYSSERRGSYNDCWSIWKLIFSILGILLASLLTCFLCYLCFKYGRENKIKNAELKALREKNKKLKLRREREREKYRDTERSLNPHVDTERSYKENRRPSPVKKKKQVVLVEKGTEALPSPQKPVPKQVQSKIPYVVESRQIIHHPKPMPPAYLSPARSFHPQPHVYHSPETTFFQNPQAPKFMSQVISPRNVRVIQPHQQSQNYPITTPLRASQNFQQNPNILRRSQMSFRRPQQEPIRVPAQVSSYTGYKDMPEKRYPDFHTPQMNRFNNHVNIDTRKPSSRRNLIERFEKENNPRPQNNYEPQVVKMPRRIKNSKKNFGRRKSPINQPQDSPSEDIPPPEPARSRRSSIPVQVRKQFRDPNSDSKSPIRPSLQPQQFMTKHPKQKLKPEIHRRPTQSPQRQRNENPGFPYTGQRGYQEHQEHQGQQEHQGSPYLARKENIITTQRGTVEKKVSSPRIEHVTVREQVSPEQVVSMVKPMLVQDTYIVEDKKMIIRPNGGNGKPREVTRRTVTSHQDIMGFSDLDSVGEWDGRY